MSDSKSGSTGPDLTRGVAADSIADGAMLSGHVGDHGVLLARVGNEYFAIGSACTHYGAPLADGIIVGETVRCPWHHACFHLRTGEALRAPALSDVTTWQVDRQDGMLYVTRQLPSFPGNAVLRAPSPDTPKSVTIIGAGAAGNAAAEMLRRTGFEGPVTMIGTEPDLPYDRPNLSKDYLAGTAQEDWIPLRGRDFYDENGIELLLGSAVTKIDSVARALTLADGKTHAFDALLLATGADPVKLNLPGSELPHVHYLRSLRDSRAIIEAAKDAHNVVVLGASFIGLEVAAALRTRGLAVRVAAPEARPLEKVLGPELGDMIRSLHEGQGVVFHLGATATAITSQMVTLTTGEDLEADLVVIGVGVRPKLGLAESAGLAVEGGVLVDEYLESSVPRIFAAGDIARWPDARTGERRRVEHWVVAERQGQTAARNLLGLRERFDAVPFFWSRHYETSISYVGHAHTWDRTVIDGDLSAGDGSVAFQSGGKTLAFATVGRDRGSLMAEHAMEADAEVLAKRPG